MIFYNRNLKAQAVDLLGYEKNNTTLKMIEGKGSRKVRKKVSPKEAKGALNPEKDHAAGRLVQIDKKELPTENSKLPTEDMEVHHHPQLEHKPKPWKEYLLEYFMIFLAVMTGFFAESYREHLGDRAKETEYMQSMVQDLRADTSEIKYAEGEFKSICAVIDTMLTCLKSDKPDPAIINRIVSENFWTYSGFSYNNRTIQQLRSSGNFRLVQNKTVADSILNYDNRENAFLPAAVNPGG
jgi:hypothetical protein